MALHFRLLTFAAPLLLLSHAASVVHQAKAANPDRTVTQVVKLLQGMLDQSKADGNSERDLFAKYKCYCDTNEASKNEEIEDLNKLIGTLENQIEELLASTGALSRKLQQLKRDIAANRKAQADATTLRGNENAEFLATQADSNAAIQQMHDAIEVLSEVGADQTSGDAARDHDKFMSNFRGSTPLGSLTALKATVRKALFAASAFAGHKQTSTIEAFLQTPFTGSYSAQSGEVVGILKDMHDTFKANLAGATAAEAKALDAYNKLMSNLQGAETVMLGEEGQAQGELSANDGNLGSKRSQLDTAKGDLASATSFLATLLEMRDSKTKQYSERVALRRKEETAISEAISILNSDAAFATFGTVSATKDGPTSFVQMHTIHSHVDSAVDGARAKAREFLQHAADSQRSPVLSRAVAVLQTKNPFSVVLEEIDKMIAVIAKDQETDDEWNAWCGSEVPDTNQAISDKEGELTTLLGTINELISEIKDPATGLEAQEAETERLIQENHDSQVTETDQRRKENQEYQKDIANLVSAEALLKRATVVLRKYYSTISSEIAPPSLVQRADPTPPATWDDKFAGQSGSAVSVVDMLTFIHGETVAEETQAHTDESTAQHAYEDSMIALKAEQGRLETSLATIQETLAQKIHDLKETHKEHEATTKDKEALEAYLTKITPGCDFITTKYTLRKDNRVAETGALNHAISMLKGSAAYTEAEDAAHQDSLGDCRDLCNDVGESHAKCKACLAKVSVPGYCAGHSGTLGC